MKNYITPLFLLITVSVHAQVRLSEDMEARSVGSSYAFLDASQSTTLNAYNSASKGIIFPTTDITAVVNDQAGDPVNSLYDLNGGGIIGSKTFYDGLIVYNTGVGAIPANGMGTSDADLVRGFYYYNNPDPDPNVANDWSWNTGTWIPLGGGTATDQLFANRVQPASDVELTLANIGSARVHIEPNTFQPTDMLLLNANNFPESTVFMIENFSGAQKTITGANFLGINHLNSNNAGASYVLENGATIFIEIQVNSDTEKFCNFIYSAGAVNQQLSYDAATHALSLEGSADVDLSSLADNSNTADVVLNADSDNNAAAPGNNIIFQEGGDEKMRITGQGRVGIGTNDPKTGLQVDNGARIVVQNSIDGGANNGILFWSKDDPKWGMYMASSQGSATNLSGTAAAVSDDINGISGSLDHALRIRIEAEATKGIFFENSNDELLASFRGSDGRAHFPGGLIISKDPVENGVLTSDATGVATWQALPTSSDNSNIEDVVLNADSDNNAAAPGNNIIFQEGGDEKMRITGDGVVRISGLATGGASQMVVADANGDLATQESFVKTWNNGTHPDIHTVVGSYSSYGKLLEGSEQGNLTVAIRDNDATDNFSVVSGGGNYTATDPAIYDKLVARFDADGNVSLDRDVDPADDSHISTFYLDGTNNRVGIGTYTPAQELDVAGGVRISGLATGGDSQMVVADTNGDLAVQAIPTGADNSNIADVVLNADSDNNAAAPGNNIIFQEGGVENMRIKGDGNVDIGTDATDSDIGLTIKSKRDATLRLISDHEDAAGGEEYNPLIELSQDGNGNTAQFGLNGPVDGGATLNGVSSYTGIAEDMAFLYSNTGLALTAPSKDIRIVNFADADATANRNIVVDKSGNLKVQELFNTWNETDNADVDALLPGSSMGTFLEGVTNGHYTIGLQDSDENDGFSIVSGGGDYTTTTPKVYDKLVARFDANGDVVMDRDALDPITNVRPATFYLDADNNRVGIGGTYRPAQELEVVGVVRISSLATGTDTFTGIDNPSQMVIADANGDLAIQAIPTGTDGDAWGVTGEDKTTTISRTGRVDFARTASISAPVDLANAALLVGTTASGIGIDNDQIATRGGDMIFDSATHGYTFYTGEDPISGDVDPSRALRFNIKSDGVIRIPDLATGGANQMVVATSSGDLTTQPLSAAGDNSNPADVILNADSDDNNANAGGNNIIFREGGVENMRITGDGNVDIGTDATDSDIGLTIKSKRDTTLRLISDHENAAGGEEYNPLIELSQDGNGNTAQFGLNGPVDSSHTGVAENMAFLYSNTGLALTAPSKDIRIVDFADADATANRRNIVVDKTGNLKVQELLNNTWNQTNNADVDGLLPGSRMGTFLQGITNGHYTIGLQDNDVDDSFNIVSGGGDYTTATPKAYDKLVARFDADGDVVLDRDVDPDTNLSSATFYLDASNNRVGIGTSPAQELDVAGGVRISSLATGGASQMVIADANGDLAVQAIPTGADNSNIADVVLNADSDNNGGSPGNNIIFQEGGNEKMRITGQGRVGIGTDTPGASLEVTTANANIPTALFGRQPGYPTLSARSSSSTYFIIDGYHDTDTDGTGPDTDEDGNVGLNYYGNGDVILANGGGNVGIGTVTPVTGLEVSNGAKIVVQNGANGGSDNGIVFWQPEDYRWAIYMASSGIDETDLSSIDGQNRAVEDESNGLTGTLSHSLRFRTANSSTRGFIFENENNDLLASIRGSDGRAHFPGGILSQSLSGSSDIRFKKNVTTLPNVLERLKKVRGVSYNWKTAEFAARGFSDKTQIGVIAQELEKAFPELVEIQADGYRTVNYLHLAPVLLQAINEQQAQIERLQAQNQKLMSMATRMEAMEAKLATLQLDNANSISPAAIRTPEEAVVATKE